MKSFLSPILALLVCSVLLFGSTECASSTDITPSPTAAQKNSTSTLSPNSTIHSTSLITTVHTSNSSTVFSVTTVPVPMPNMTANHSTVVSTSHPINTSVHHNSTYMTLTSVIMTSSAGNGSIHNSTIHPTPLPTHSVNMSSTVVHNASSHIHPTMTPSPTPATPVVPSSSAWLPTTPPPLPLPKGKYYVSKKGSKCLLLWLSLKFTITYKNKYGNESHANVIMPSNGTADGICEQSVSSIRISWPHYSIEAYFHTQKAANGGWVTTNITITAETRNNSDFSNANATIIRQSVKNPSQLEWLSGHVGMSLNCSVNEKLKFDDLTATISWLRIQPFEVKGGDFAKQTDSCSPTPVPPTKSPSHKKKNNKVAIAVGCSLAALVLIVLIGYFVAKRVRSRPGTGYRKL